MHWKDLLNDFACPACKKPLVLGTAPDTIKCTGCNRVYPVQDDIPILLIDRAKTTPET